jgi:hypothetical protein
MAKKNFKEPSSTPVFTTKFILNDKQDITTVYHYAEDGVWQFDSNDQYNRYEEVVKIVGLGEIINLDPSILEIADLPLGFFAKRNSKKDSWVINKIS